MNTLPWKKIALVVIVLAVFVAGLFYITKSKGTKPAEAFINPAFGEYISSFTSGVIASGSSVRIVLAENAVDSSFVGQESSVALFDFKPSVKGKTVWLDARTVEFRPDARLTSGQVYEVEFSLGKLFTHLTSELSTFKYSFQVIPLNFEVAIDNIKPYLKTDLKRQKVEGTLSTSDYADSEAVEKTVNAVQDGKTLKLTWAHLNEGRQHTFTIEEVERKEAASKVALSIDGKPLSVDRTDSKEIEIPALGDFKVTNVRVEQSSNQHVVIQFSDPLNEKQNVEGLISISDLRDLDYEIRDNEIKVYPPVRQAGTKTITIEPGIKNILDYKLSETATFDVMFEQLNPAVRFTGKGNILPSTDGLILPFEAVNLKSVDVQIIKIYEKNILQFFQVNDYQGSSELRRVGKPVLNKTISLENSGLNDLGKWNRFTLDIATLINTEPGAIYQVRIGFRKSHAVFACSEGEDPGSSGNSAAFDEQEFDSEANESSYWDSYEQYYYDEDYDWDERDNPCHSSYYNANRIIRRNVLASDLGLMAKRGGDGNTIIFVNDLRTTAPLAGVSLELYDYQQQVIGTASTGPDGKAIINSKTAPFALVAKNGNQRGYLKMFDGEAQSVSNFDVGGERITKGLKGFLYGDRGVWRPGDSLFLTFILQDKMNLLPDNHPVVLELQDPQGQVANRLVRSSSENGFYKFATATRSDAPTGNWTARVKVGGAEFSETVKIETVKPNRLKINLDFGVDKIKAGNTNLTGDLQINWLHGAPGRNLKAQFEVVLTPGETKFARYPDYAFEDPSQKFTSEVQSVFDGYVDEEGKAQINATLQPATGAAGVLNAVFRGKAFEESGNFSVDRFSLPFYPYESFTGIRLPAGDKSRGMLLTDTTHTVDIVTIDADGQPVSRNNIEVSLYKLRWRWWWETQSQNSIYLSGDYATLMKNATIKTSNGKGTWSFRVAENEWGRYLVRAFDPVSGHSTAKVVYIDWPGWAGRARQSGDGATMLSFSSDKPAYNIGEKATVVIPGSGEGRALVTIENGSRVVESYWVETKKGDNPFSFEITREMTPNVFVHITSLQPHSQTVNDLPIRMYGIIPLQVEDPATHLAPVIEMPDVLEPGQEVVIKISEKEKRKMTYTIAMVDEGLLDLTRFRTPDPWKRFYAREALGVKTWDLYNDVMGAFGAKLERLLAIGGDDELKGKDDDAKANRFKPVVKYFGPFTLDGGTAEHAFTMPQYIGSVKTMVVAGYEGAYGSTEKATPVRKPLMVLATLPRVLGPDEKVKLLVTLFAMEKSIKNVKVEVKSSGPLQTVSSVQNVVMSGSDMTVDFDLTVKSVLGVGKVEVIATSGSYSAKDNIEIDIRNANPPVTRVVEGIIEGNKAWSGNVTPVGMAGTNSAVLEVSSIPPINLGQRLRYLIQYPYGCIEQTTSSVFPQLYLDQIKPMTKNESETMQRNVRAGIERLKSFQQRDGGFTYWPGMQDYDSWSSTYAGHFLVEAEAKGYFVPNEMIKRWKKFQRTKAQEWRKNKEYYSSELIQAYRLYSLALAGDPEIGAMNKLREQGSLPPTAAWLLAAAYAKAGQTEAAKTLISKLPTLVKPYQEMAYSYGSDDRDKAIILETLTLVGDRTKGFELLKDISKELSDDQQWMSTQTTAWCLKAVAGFVSLQDRGELKFSYTHNGKEVTASTELPVAQVELPVDGAKAAALKVQSESKGVLFVRMITEGTPSRGEEKEEASNLSVSVSYADNDGNPIDISSLQQGTQFIATVTITNPGTKGLYQNLALSQIFPSGWEINNLRLDDAQKRLKGDVPTYQDIRDDRVYTYFDLSATQRKTFQVLLTATYAGTYYLPAVSCEAMYDRTIYSRTKGQVVEVIKQVTE